MGSMGWTEAAAFEAGHLQACSSPPLAQGIKSNAATVCCAFAFPYLGDALVGPLGTISHLDGAARCGMAPESRWRHPAVLADVCHPDRGQATSPPSVATDVILCLVCPCPPGPLKCSSEKPIRCLQGIQCLELHF